MARAKAEPAAPKRMNINLMHWLARRRVPIGFVCAALALWLAQPTTRSLVWGAAVAFVGELLRVWAAGHLEKGREVTVSGPYAFTRHPLYVGSSIVGAGVSIASASPVVAILTAVYLAVTLSAAIRTEEQHLTEKFGNSYPDYRDGRGGATSRRFSVARVMRNREYRAIAGLASALALLSLKTL